MLIIGAGGHAKEVLEVFYQNNALENIYFFDDVTENMPNMIYQKFKVIKTISEVENLFKIRENTFVLGVGSSFIRYKLAKKFIALGGKLCSAVSPFAQIGHYEVVLGKGVDIMTNTVITNNVIIGEGTLLNRNTNISHDAIIGKYCEFSPSVNISGNCTIGNFCSFGTGAIVLPKITIGDNVIVGAGAVVTQGVESNSVVVGIPAKVIRKLEPLNF